MLRRAPATPQAHYLLGAVLFEQKRNDEAKAHLERELALDPRCFGCMAKLAHVAYLEGRRPRVRVAGSRRAAALDPDDVETNLVSGMLENRTGRYDRGDRAPVPRRRAAPRPTSQARYQLALAYQRSGNAEKAREQLEIYDRLIQEQKARSIGVRGSEE